MTDFQSLENIAKVMRTFKAEQENVILRSVNDMKYSKSAKVKFLPPEATKTEIHENNEQILTKILNIDCIMMPQAANAINFQKLWPTALIANRNTNSVFYFHF